MRMLVKHTSNTTGKNKEAVKIQDHTLRNSYHDHIAQRPPDSL